jgi:hypothetical protein
MRGKQATFPLFLRQFQSLLQLGQRRDAIPKLPMPVVPLGGGHILPKALAGMPVFAKVLRVHQLRDLT